ncbi:MAG TPA: ABC transporter, partial [candidate division Zixibacteria bacterium]|nr:ABC transporter [candidate division Zixibacteria bacterium]
PTMILEDPIPAFNLAMAPLLPSDAQRNPFMQNQPAPEPKGDIVSFMQDLGVSFNPNYIVWCNFNPHPELVQLPPEILFISAADKTTEAFNPLSDASKGLQELVAIYSGILNKAPDSKYDFQSLLQCGRVSGILQFQQVVQRGFFGMGLTLNRNVRHVPDGNIYTVAARVWGTTPPAGEGETEKKVNLIAIADIDFIGEQFFMMRERGVGNLSFDNVSFFLNGIDLLMNDYSFIPLRQKRVKHRTLESVEAATRNYVEQRLNDEKTAEGEAQQALTDAQQRLNEKVSQLRNRQDLDEQTKQIMAQNLQEVENRRFEALQASIDAKKNATILASKEKMESSIRNIQSRIKTLAVTLPPIPVLTLGVVIFVKRRRREMEGAAMARRLRS